MPAAVSANIFSRFSVNGPAPQGLPPVPDFLAARQGQLALDEIVLRIKPRRDERQAALSGFPGKLLDLVSAKQQPARTQRVVVEVASRRVRADVTVQQPNLVTLHRGIAVLEAGLALADGFHFGPRQLHARFKFFEKEIKMRRLTIDSKISGCSRGLAAHKANMLSHAEDREIACVKDNKEFKGNRRVGCEGLH